MDDEILESPEEFAYLPKILNGGLAGVIGVSCVFPIDLVKTRLQNQQAKYRGILDCAHKTWNAGGSSTFARMRALYAGSSVNILLVTPEKAIKLVANDFFRHHLTIPGEPGLSAGRAMLAGGLAGVCQIVVTTPMELLKIQMQMAGGSARLLISNLLRQKGIRGLYRGVGSTLARDGFFSMIYFPLFAELNSLGPKNSNGEPQFWWSFVSGVLGGATACFCVTPMDVVKTRIQTLSTDSSRQYRSVFDAFTKILTREGPRALFRGAACRMMVVAPLFGIAQMIYYIGVAEYFLGLE